MSLLVHRFKLYSQSEVRRFDVPKSVASVYSTVKENVEALYSEWKRGVGGKEYDLTWVDADGDHIKIESDREMDIALDDSKDICKIHVTQRQDKKKNTTKGKDEKAAEEEGWNYQGLNHPYIRCDGCTKASLSGYRFKCISCPDYDLCSNCHAENKHSFHEFLRIGLHYMGPSIPSKDSAWNGSVPFETINRVTSSIKRNFSLYSHLIFHNLQVSGNPSMSSYCASTPKTEEPSKSTQNVNVTDVPTVVTTSVTTKVPEKDGISSSQTVTTSTTSTTSDQQTSSPVPETKEAETANSSSSSSSSTDEAEWDLVQPMEKDNDVSESIEIPIQRSDKSAQQMMYPKLDESQKDNTNGALPIYSPKIQTALQAMLDMGYGNDNGILGHLLERHNADIGKVLDSLAML